MYYDLTLNFKHQSVHVFSLLMEGKVHSISHYDYLVLKDAFMAFNYFLSGKWEQTKTFLLV